MRTEENEEERENRRRKKRILIQILVSIACSDQGLRIVLCGEPKKDDMQIFKLPSEMLQNALAKHLVVRLGSPNLRIRERNEIYLSAFHALTKCGKKITPENKGEKTERGKFSMHHSCSSFPLRFSFSASKRKEANLTVKLAR